MAPLRKNSPERLTKPFNSCTPWHQRWLACARSPVFSAFFWMISLARGSSNAPWKTIPPRCCQHVCSLTTKPWEWLPLIPQPVWLQAGPSNWLGAPVSPLAIISQCPLADSCSLPLERGHRLVAARPPRVSFTLTPALSLFSLSLGLCLSLSGASWYTQLSAPTGHGTVDM